MCLRRGEPRRTARDFRTRPRPSDGLSVGDFRKVLMKTGLVLVVLGHVSFIVAALLHGTVLRYVAAPHDAVALQYCMVDILSVTSAILVITSGIAVIVLSRYLPSVPLGRALLAACTFGSPELLALAPDCPFDPTRIYSSSLCLWGISLLFCMAESVFAVRCAQLAHQLLKLRPWLGKSNHHLTQSQQAWQPPVSLPMQESPEPVEDRDLLSYTSSEPLTL
ncbi:transmembrane protein 54 isoform X5 [Camelus ferus]|uniref:Transmembrane protein 54 isoform X5 n=1 Tax=Camelus ferus TaxID=419612 RepID=A0A8B8UBS6_CAMFR|nr:transmembrane protein 54 isoform X5 [Camelus dromedarius]XP_032351737.1 transmembrane protein 54 isoform X5 [Camelus ferus]